MTLNQDTFDLLREKYRVYDIETRYESFDSFGASDREVTMRVSLTGFERMMRDLFNPERAVIDTRDVFAVSPMEVTSDKKFVYLAKYSMDKYPLDIVAAYGENFSKPFQPKDAQEFYSQTHLTFPFLPLSS